ncbi:hypothetical protein THAOC_37419, partial [Thalassiosira oceanica]
MSGVPAERETGWLQQRLPEHPGPVVLSLPPAAAAGSRESGRQGPVRDAPRRARREGGGAAEEEVRRHGKRAGQGAPAGRDGGIPQGGGGKGGQARGPGGGRPGQAARDGAKEGRRAASGGLATLKGDIRECRIRHAVHCSHMKAAVDSLRHVLVVDKADDPTGLLGRRRLADLTGEEREEVGAMVDEIAQDVDIQLSKMGRMMADMRDRMEEIRRLSEPVAGGEDGRDEEGKGGGNELLALSRECAKVFGSFSDEVLRAVSSTSMSPASGGNGSAEDAGAASADASDEAFGGVRSILESIRRRREAADLVREREGVETRIAIVQGEIKRVQEAMEEENRLHEEVVRRLTSKIDALTEDKEVAPPSSSQGSRITSPVASNRSSIQGLSCLRGLYRAVPSRAGPTRPSLASPSAAPSGLAGTGAGMLSTRVQYGEEEAFAGQGGGGGSGLTSSAGYVLPLGTRQVVRYVGRSGRTAG